jgi:hypothetical protein
LGHASDVISVIFVINSSSESQLLFVPIFQPLIDHVLPFDFSPATRQLVLGMPFLASAHNQKRKTLPKQKQLRRCEYNQNLPGQERKCQKQNKLLVRHPVTMPLLAYSLLSACRKGLGLTHVLLSTNCITQNYPT